jgi:predicted  nucleic acid-binding Zn-ribbon protein
VTSALKSWPVTLKNHGNTEAKTQFIFGIFECPRCKSKFRSRVEPACATTPERSSVAELVKRINSIRQKLTQTLRSLRVKIKTLETERALLLTEIQELKRAATLRASALESEVSELREEINSLREVLGQSAHEA